MSAPPEALCHRLVLLLRTATADTVLTLPAAAPACAATMQSARPACVRALQVSQAATAQTVRLAFTLSLPHANLKKASVNLAAHLASAVATRTALTVFAVY